MAVIIDSGLATVAEGADTFITNGLTVTGAIHWVDSQTGDNANSGSESSPLATLAQAITNATANNGDVIVIKSGHAETLATPIVVSKAGLKIFGIGNGSAAPKFTVAGAIDGFQVTGASVELNNLFFPVGTTVANTSRVKVDAPNVRIKGCAFDAGAFDLMTIRLTANALYAKIESCSISITADGPDYGILIEAAAVAGLFIKDCSFDGGDFNFDFAAIFSAFAHLNFHYQDLTLTGDAGISHTAGGNKGWLSNIEAGEGSTVQV